MATAEERIKDMMSMSDAECARSVAMMLSEIPEKFPGAPDELLSVVAEGCMAKLIGEIREAERRRSKLAARGSAVAAGIKETDT